MACQFIKEKGTIPSKNYQGVSMNLDKAIYNRRSIRAFTDRFVTDGEVEDLIDSARWAPSWANTQSWEFIAVRDPDMKARVVDTFSSTNPARSCSLQASVLIVVCGWQKKAGYRKGELRTMHREWFMWDLGMAVQNLSLKAHSMGLGTVVVGSMDHHECGALLNLPDEMTVAAVLPLGEPAVGEVKVPRRREVGEILHRETYGGSWKPDDQ